MSDESKVTFDPEDPPHLESHIPKPTGGGPPEFRVTHPGHGPFVATERNEHGTSLFAGNAKMMAAWFEVWLKEQEGT